MLVELSLVLEVDLATPLLDLEEWRLSDVEVTGRDHLRHFSVEKCQKERPDMRAIDIRVGHDDDAVVAQLRGHELFF